MRLPPSEQWTEVEQHDQFCFAMEGLPSEYYTLLLETDPGVRLGAILKKFNKRFGLSAPHLTHQLKFHWAVQGSGESLHQWSDRVLTLAIRAFPQLPEMHVPAISRLCYGAKDKDAGMFALDGQPKAVEEAVDRMQFYENSRQFCPSLPKHEAVRTAVLEEDQVKCVEERNSALGRYWSCRIVCRTCGGPCLDVPL